MCWPKMVFWLEQDSQAGDFVGFPCIEEQLSVAVKHLCDSGLDEWKCYARLPPTWASEE